MERKSKFSTIGLSFYEIFTMKGELKAMFDSSEEIRNYWKQPSEPSSVPDNIQVSSQDS